MRLSIMYIVVVNDALTLLEDEMTKRLELDSPEEALTRFPNMLGRIACAMLREFGIYRCTINGIKTDIVLTH